MKHETLAIISTWAGILPFIAGIIAFRKAGFAYRLFVFFLLYGFLTDVAVWRFNVLGLRFEPRSVFYFYALFEALFFCWFVYRVSENIPVSDSAFILMLLIPFAWALAYINFNVITWKNFPSDAVFTTVYEMTVSVLAGWSILQLTQKNEPLRNMPSFWFLTGIFILCFCTFIVSSFNQNIMIRNKIWFVQNIANLIAYIFYTIGFLKIQSRKTPVLLKQVG